MSSAGSAWPPCEPTSRFSKCSGRVLIAHAFPGPRHADEHGASPRRGHPPGLLDERDRPGGVHRDVHAGRTGDGAHLRRGVALRGIDHVRRPEGRRHRQLRRVAVDRDDRPGRHERRPLHDREADPAGAVDDDRLADAQLRVVDDHPEAGRDRAAEQRRDGEVDLVGNRRHPVLRDDGVLVEGRHPAGVDRALTPAVVRRGRLDAAALAPVQHDAVALPDVADTRPDVFDDSASLVPEQVRQELVRPLHGVDLADLRAADPARVHAHQHLAVLEALRQIDVRDHERPT